ncbi:MAG: LysM domain-containing protein [Clostridia bacterium]|nr:LysM domain-containing protein [Clostridia bacterium]
MKKIFAAVVLIYAAYHLVSFMNPPVYESKLEYHRVVQGDTLWFIAESYYGKQDKITNFNEWVTPSARLMDFTESDICKSGTLW